MTLETQTRIDDETTCTVYYYDIGINTFSVTEVICYVNHVRLRPALRLAAERGDTAQVGEIGVLTADRNRGRHNKILVQRFCFGLQQFYINPFSDPGHRCRSKDRLNRKKIY